VANLDGEVQNLLGILQRYNAEKAGELDLGAEYRGGRYFHFSVKKEDFPKLLEELRTTDLENFTNVKARSDRQSKEGYTRIVFLLKQK
jgi:hypothetical protein